MHYDILINCESGSGTFQSQEMRDRLREVFTGSGHRADIHFIAPGDLDATMPKLAKNEADALIVGGGDGTVNFAASLLRGTDKALGILPLGTFNLEARDLDIDLDPFVAARQLLDAKPMQIDVLTVNGRTCLCACVIGFYPAMAKARAEFHGSSWWKKSLRIIREIGTVAVKSPVLELEIIADGKKKRCRTRLAAFAPGQFVEGFGLIPERDSLNSGKLSAYVSEHITRSQMLQAAWEFLTGSIFGTDGLTHLTGEEITVNVRRKKSLPTMIDGETMDIEIPYHLKIHPRSLRVLHPKNTSD